MEGIPINFFGLMSLYVRRKYDELSSELLLILNQLNESLIFLNFKPEDRHILNRFVQTFLFLFTQPDYQVSYDHILRFIKFNPLISNLVAISHLQNTDFHLHLIRKDGQNLGKILTLYSARNQTYIDYDILYRGNSDLFYAWYSLFFVPFHSLVADKNGYENLKNHISRGLDLKVEFEFLTNYLPTLMYGSSYIDEDNDSSLKKRVNKSIRNTVSRFDSESLKNRNPHKIAIVSSVMKPGHSVYRNLFQFITSLCGDFELTYFCLGVYKNRISDDPLISLFQKVIYLDDHVDLGILKNNDFMVIFYPDVGMDSLTIALSNQRLAPIQACGLGHSVSTWGSQIDYFISGKEVEISDHPEQNYSERLVLIPGYGILHNPIKYFPKSSSKKGDKSRFIINCPWTTQKVNYPFLCSLREILQKSSKDILFRIFVGTYETLNVDYIPFSEAVKKVLGKNNVDIIFALSYKKYMAMLEEGNICIDSYHYGGCNTVVDNLYLRKPVVTLKGRKWYNRIGSKIIEDVGLPELVARDVRKYNGIVLRLIQDDEYLLSIERKLQDNTNLENILFSTQNKGYFKKAIQFLISNHEKLQKEEDRSPILIEP